MRSIIVAYDQNRGIGAVNDIMWGRSLPADQQRFKTLTMGSTLIMGRKTYESIGFPLPGRHTIVVSRQPIAFDGVVVVASLEDAYQAAQTENVFIAGGGQIYKQALDSVDQILATEVDASFPTAEIFFPRLDAAVWKESSREHHDADETNKFPFDFVTYTKQR